MASRFSLARACVTRRPEDLEEWINADPFRASLTCFLAAWSDPVYLVGGSVRDALLGLPTVDLDFAVAGHAVALGRAVADKFGGALVVMDPERDVARVVVGRGAQAEHWDIAGLRAATIEEDLLARDMTINALAVSVRLPMVFFDPAGGLDDLLRGLLRVATRTAFVDDPVRVIRLARFRGRLRFAVEPITRRLAKEGGSLLPSCSAERLRDELFALLQLPLAWKALSYVSRIGAVGGLFSGTPGWDGAAFRAGLACLRALEQWMGDCCEGVEAMTADAVEPPHKLLLRDWSDALVGGRTRGQAVKLAALFADLSPDDAQAGCEALRLGNAEVQLVRRSVAAARALRHGLSSQDGVGIHRFFRRYERAGVEGAALAWARWSLEDARLALNAWFQRHGEVIDPRRLVTGRDVMRVCGIEAGPRVGEILEKVREGQVRGAIGSRQQALAWLERESRGDRGHR